MENIVPLRIQILTIIVSILFLLYIGRLIIKRKLREEYSIIWVIATVTLIIFSFWTDGLTIIANFLGIRVASNLIFTGAIFLILIYLIHLSIIVSKLHENNKKLAQNLTMMKEKMEKEVIEKKN